MVVPVPQDQVDPYFLSRLSDPLKAEQEHEKEQKVKQEQQEQHEQQKKHEKLGKKGYEERGSRECQPDGKS